MTIGLLAIFFIPQTIWGWLLLLAIVWIFYRRFTARTLGRTVGNFRSGVNPSAAAPKALSRVDEALDRNFKALDLPTNASYDQVKSSYRELVKVWHPDRFGQDVKLKERANTKLMEINQAYENLKRHFERR